MDKPIWVIMATQGEYDDKWTWPFEYCLSLDQANSRVKALKILEDKLEASYFFGDIIKLRNELLIEFAEKYSLDYEFKINYLHFEEVNIIHSDKSVTVEFDDEEMNNDWADIFDKYPEYYDRTSYVYELVNPSPKSE